MLVKSFDCVQTQWHFSGRFFILIPYPTSQEKKKKKNIGATAMPTGDGTLGYHNYGTGTVKDSTQIVPQAKKCKSIRRLST
jgi:hypothetical protein